MSEGSTVLDGEHLATGRGGELRVQCDTIRLVLKESSAMRIFHAGNQTVVEFEHGTLGYSTSGHSEALTIYSLDVRVVPTTSQPSTGQISSPSHCELTVYAIQNSVTVTSGGETRVIEESKSFAVRADEGVDYDDDWKPVLRDYPEFPRDADYHHSHRHVACAPAYARQARKPPIGAASAGHFREVAIALIVGGSIIAIKKGFESPDRP